MINKKIFLTAATLIFVAGIFYSCDEVDHPYINDNCVACANDTCDFPADVNPVFRKVLLEDFTGHLCGTCPNAAALIYTPATGLKAQYGDALITLGVHASLNLVFTEPELPDYPEDFRTPAGEKYAADFGISSNPTGSVSRKGYPGSILKPTGQWGSSISALTLTPAQAKIQILNTYSDASGDLKICVKATFLSALSGTYNLCVVLEEDSIIAWQKDYNLPPPQHDTDYVHRHVMRGAVNSPYGEEIKSGSVAAGDNVVKSYCMNLLNLPSCINTTHPTINVDHCSVIAYVMDATTREILQVEEKKVR